MFTQENETPQVKDPNQLDPDLKKAVAFLLSKEMKEYSLDKKKEFLLKKLPSEIVDKAISLYPVIESNINSHIQEYKEQKQTASNKDESLLSNFFNLGVLSSVLLTTLGINYLIDLNRNKKNDLFYKECERKINEELSKNTKELKSEIGQELNEYVNKDSLKDKVNCQLVEFTQQRGLNLNLSSKSVKEELAKLKSDLEGKDKLIKDLNVKIDNSKVLLKEEILKETNNLIEDNSNKLLIKILENQDKLLMMVSNAIKNKETVNQNVIVPSSKKLLETFTANLDVKTEPKNIEENINMEGIIDSQSDSDFSNLLDSIIASIKSGKDKTPLLKQLKNQFSAISETLKKDEKKESLPFINITNRTYKNCNGTLLSQLLKRVGFKNESGSIFKFEGIVEDLDSAIEVIENIENIDNTENQ